MSNANVSPSFDVEQEYRAIEKALLDNARGRWFLAEHGRRSRRLDSLLLEQSISRLQTALREPPAVVGRLVGEVEALSLEVASTREAILARQSAASTTANGERPLQVMLRAAEELHELMWQLQGRDVDAVTCERIGRQAALIQALGSAQAAESERALMLAAALDKLAARLDGILATLAEENSGDMLMTDDGSAGAEAALAIDDLTRPA